MSKKVKWRSGPPPSVGWWPASATCTHGLLRWWDGDRWSTCATEYDTAEYAAEMAVMEAAWSTAAIKWTDRPASWPARSKT